MAHSEANKLNIYNKIVLYKTVIRSHADYGAPAIHDTKTEIEKLEKDQVRTLKKLPKLNYRTVDTTLLTALDIPTMSHGLAMQKNKFWLKLNQQQDQRCTQYKSRSLATKACNDMKTGCTLRTQHYHQPQQCKI